MADAKTCPTCGAQLAADAPGGVCPKCLLMAGFATGAGSAAAAPPRVPTPEELAPHFPTLVIERLLGRGGMGVVYKARHKALDRDVALKVLPATVATDPAFAERFQREARALARLQHGNIVLVHDFGQTDGLFWLVMEYVDGTNIRQAMKAGTIGPSEALAIVPQICDALQYAHEHGVVHRDIKPENVLLDKAGRVKVADFGLAKMMEHGETDRTLTGAGQVMGTPHYMAPEQWERPNDVDHRADIYSLGVVFYEMLTGELPVGRFAAPSKKSDVDARIDEIVMRTLEREREARYQRADEVKTDVGRATSAAASAASSDPGPRIEAAVQDLMGNVAGVVAAAGAAAAAAPHGRVHGRWHWDSAEEKARGGRVSRLAVAGVLAAPVAIVAMIVLAWWSPFGDEGEWLVSVTGVGLLAAGSIASIVSWVRIQNSGDRLRGRAWAAVGTFAPLLVCCAGMPLAFFLTAKRPPAPPFEAPAPDARSSLLSPVDTREQLKDLWEGLQREHSRLSPATYTDAERYYDRESWARISAIPAAEREELARRGEIGLPFADTVFLGEPLSAFNAFGIAVNEATRTATLTARSDRHTLIAAARFAERGWRFTDDPVQIRDGVEGGPPRRGFLLSSALPEVDGATETPRILDLWRRLTDALAHRNADAAYALYMPPDAAELRAMSPEAMAAKIRGGGPQGGHLGLPFFALVSDPAQTPAGYRLTDAGVTDIVGASDGTRIVRVSAWADSPTGKLHFHLRGRIVGSGAEQRIDWYFEKGHVNRL
jgi:predicted Ser/Thr protein kinase